MTVKVIYRDSTSFCTNWFTCHFEKCHDIRTYRSTFHYYSSFLQVRIAQWNCEVSFSLYNRRFMSQATRTRHFVRSARRGEEEKKRLWQFSNNGTRLHRSFWHQRRQSIFVRVGGRKSQNGLVTGALFFLLPSSHTSRKMPRLPCFAHKAPVTPARFAMNLNWILKA